MKSVQAARSLKCTWFPGLALPHMLVEQANEILVVLQN
jgi:hypothetical protein